MSVESADDFFAVLQESPATVEIVLGDDDVLEVGIKRLAPADCALLFQRNAAIRWLEKYPDYVPGQDDAVAMMDETLDTGELLEQVDIDATPEQAPRVQDVVWFQARRLVELCQGATGSADQLNHVITGCCDPDGKPLFTTEAHFKKLAAYVPQAEINKIDQAVRRGYTKAREVEQHTKNSGQASQIGV